MSSDKNRFPGDLSRRARLFEHKPGHIAAVAGFMALLLVLCAAAEGLAGDYRVRRKTSNHVVDALINRNPPVMGENTIRIEIRDTKGRYLTGARVSVNYYMPPMPGMVPMNYTVTAVEDGGRYRARMNFIMTGPWNIVIHFNAGGRPLQVVIPIDVR